MEKKMLLYEMIRDYMDVDESSRALLYLGKSIDYGCVMRSIDDAAARLTRFVGEGDVATIVMPNTPECIYCFYALNRLGVIAHMVHPLTPLNQLRKFMTAAKSKLLVTLSINLEKYRPIADAVPIVSIHPARALPCIARVIFDIQNRPFKGDRTNIIDYDDLEAGELPPVTKRDPETTGVYLHSGGTSGESKIIELSDDSINALAARGLSTLGIDDGRGMYMLAALPMFHGFGLAMGVHAILAHGAVSVLMPKFDAKTTVKLIKKNRMHFIIGVPNLFRALLRRPDFNGDMLKNIYVGFVGGDCAPQDLLDEFNSRMEQAGAKGRLFEGYGLTETVTVCAVNNYAHSRRGSMGRLLPGLKGAVVEPNTSVRVPTGENGELCVAGDTLMNGYLDNPEENEKTFLELDGERYIRTGDYGHIDEDGFMYFIQRIKRIIKIAGISVFPKEIESAAMELDGVTGACAVAYDETKKTKIALFYTGEEKPAQEFKTKIENELSHYAVPTIVKRIDAIPLTPVMKANTVELTALAERINRGEEL